MDKEVYKIVYENYDASISSGMNPFNLLWALTKSFRCRRIYKEEGLNKSIQYITRCSKEKEHAKCMNRDMIVYQMRKVMVTHNLVCRLFKKTFNCLENSLSLAACLVSLGYHVQLIIGKSTNYVNRFFDFHAWVSFEGQPVNDTGQVLEMYVPVLKKEI